MESALLDYLAADFVAHGHDFNHLLETILLSKAYELPSISEAAPAKSYVFRGPQVRRLTAEQYVDSISALTGEWRTHLTSRARQAVQARDYQLRISPLTLALGRPTREQVVTERAQEATTLQALELVNGRDLFRLVSIGAQRLRGERKPAPVPLWDSGPVGTGSVKNPPSVDLDVSGLNEIHFVVADQGSYDPEQTRPLWAQANFDGQPVALEMRGASGQIRLDLRGKGYKRFRAITTHPPETLRSDINPSVRFFVFGEKPDLERLVPVAPETPVPAPPSGLRENELVERIYRHAYGRRPTAKEFAIASSVAASTAGLADLLWAIAVSPEFQLIL